MAFETLDLLYQFKQYLHLTKLISNNLVFFDMVLNDNYIRIISTQVVNVKESESHSN